MRNQVFKKLFSVLLALIMVAGLLPASAMAGGWGAMDVDTTPELTETEQPTESAEPTAPTETETPEVTEVPEPTPENPAATNESTQEITIAPVNEVAAQANGVTTVIAGSDFQNKSGDGSGKVVVQNIIQSMIDGGITSVDGFLFAGDYWIDMIPNKDDTAMLGHVNSLRDAVKEKYTNLTYDNMVCIQGNHDQVTPDPNKNGLSKSGAHDTNAYGVYVINEDDYMWASNASHSSTSYSGMSAEAIVKQTAANLKTYLDAKTAEKYDKPIFVVSHLPLHYSMRTRNDGDCMYANLIFDVLNTAGNNGLNIIFMYGHDHSNGWDDYLGGSAVYLAKGDKINIAQASKTVFNVETLNFTYMNAGFTGYYENHNGADDTLTMTVFKITDDTVTVERYDANGKHNLKSVGVTNSYKNEDGYAPNTTVYECPQTITLATVTPPETVSDGNVSVTARGLTGLTAAKNTVTVDTSKYSAYASYDITPEGYTQGNTATVTITLDENDGFNASRKVTVIDQTGINPDTTVSIVDGTVTFTTTHFSTYDIAQEALAEPAERTYTLVTSETELVSGDQYLLIYNGTKFVLPEIVTRSNDSGEQRTGMDLEATDVASGGPATITGQYQAKEWQLVSSSGGWLLSNGTQQIKLTNTNNLGITATFEDAGSPFSLNFNTSHLVSFTHGNWELNYNESRGLINGYDSGSTAARMYIYRLTSEGATEPAEPTEKTIYLYVGQTRTDTIDGEYHTTYTSTNESAVTVTISGTQGQDGQTTYTEANVTCDTLIEDKSDSWQDTGYYYKADDGNYYRLYAMRSKKNDGRYTYTWGYRSSSDSVTEISKQTNGKDTKPNITVYNTPTTTPAVPASTTVTFTGRAAGTAIVKVGSVTYRVIVREKAQLNDYPEYPNEGSVRVEKTGQGVDFQKTGVAKIELSTTGVPVKKGADVIIMVDTSSSMSWDGRIEALRASLKNLMKQFQAVGADGQPLDIRVAIADFNGYVTSGEDNTPYRLKSVDHLNGTTTRTGTNAAKVYTGSTQLNADAFVTAEQAASVINSIETSSGTNYDYAFDATYQLGQAILTRNAQDGEERDLFVIFMSDGAPFQYNYFSSQSEAANWNNWLQGTYASASDVPSDSEHKYFYNGSGNKHRMAEAIKGNPDEMYTVIRKDSTDNYGEQQYMTQLPGLGATMYSIGFCLEQDKQITVASMEYVLKNISSDSKKFYYKVNTADELSNAFASIGNEIAYAATNARFVDTMGADYDLQMKSSTYTLSDGTTTKTITPEIIVQAYDIYTKADNVAESEIGKRKGTSTVLEKVTFNEGGTEAYSDKKSGNILVDGVICANTFWYNTTGSTVSIDTNGDGTNDYNLAPETFYWKMGTINQTELALSYYVYLTGSMEGTRAAGSYPTNESATLHYTNWLGNEAKKDTVSPVMPWESANVSYAFYLVDGEGKPVTNQTTGATGSFANAVKVTQPVVYSEVLLNSGAEVEANIVAQNALPAGYELYDADATYTVSVRSGDGTGSWTITKGNSAAATTYVAQYDPNNSAAVSNALLSTEVNGGQNNYTHTVVWFAVKYQISCVPDAVVIDFGLPVDISVLANDILGEGAAVMGLAAVGSIPAAQGTAELAGGFSPNGYTGTYGTATINGTKVRYTPGSMKMDNTEKFAYAAQANLENDQKYYYSTVTVIPAANIYYEDSFVTFDGAWEPVGQAKDGITQQEDRPGQFSLSAYDANNVYGFDSAYTKCTEYSLGSAQKVTVNRTTNDNPPTATFTFTGTGFDLISLTSNTTGTILVDVYNGNAAIGEAAHKWIVDTYYGYTRTDAGYNKYTWTKGEDGKWHVTKEKVDTLPDGAVLDGTPVNSGDVTYSRNYTWAVTKDTNNALYQIPVIRGQGLEYGTYTVVITPMFSSVLDHAGNDSYDFYLDAVRIYDPAGKNPDGEIGDAYKADGEGWPEIIELRNLLIEKKSLTEADSNAKGIVFVDGKAAAEVTDYTNFGPNNEVYLAKDQAIAFKLSVADPSNIASIQLAAKSPNGGATAKVNADGTATSIATATEMYYTITHRVTWGSGTDGQSNTIVVANIGNNILSLTNIKITYKQQPTASTQAVAIVDNEVVEQAPAMLLSMMGIKDPEPEPEPEPEKTFEPERFEASWSRNVMQGRKATLTVKTSEDVEAITVDGQTIRSYRTRSERVGFGRRAKRITYREFTYSMVAQETADFSVTAINAEGTESEAITARLTVKTRPNSMRDMWDWFKGWF
ncbi:MAG: VWA domain-containing protein [Christensenellaceae bacterium]|nr:VWA domain-containing protein [Christensenellaceae bacterium]